MIEDDLQVEAARAALQTRALFKSRWSSVTLCKLPASLTGLEVDYLAGSCVYFTVRVWATVGGTYYQPCWWMLQRENYGGSDVEWKLLAEQCSQHIEKGWLWVMYLSQTFTWQREARCMLCFSLLKKIHKWGFDVCVWAHLTWKPHY